MVDPPQSSPAHQHNRRSSRTIRSRMDQSCPIGTSNPPAPSTTIHPCRSASCDRAAEYLAWLCNVLPRRLPRRERAGPESVGTDEIERIPRTGRSHQTTGIGLISRLGLHAGFNRFHDAHRTAHEHQLAGKRGRHDGFAHAGIRTGHKDSVTHSHALSVTQAVENSVPLCTIDKSGIWDHESTSQQDAQNDRPARPQGVRRQKRTFTVGRKETDD